MSFQIITFFSQCLSVISLLLFLFVMQIRRQIRDAILRYYVIVISRHASKWRSASTTTPIALLGQAQSVLIRDKFGPCGY